MNQKIGQRKTEQREVIYDIISSAPGPLAVTDILRIANTNKQKTALSTIYRTIKLLLKYEKITIINLPDGQPRYAIPSCEHRHYFYCKNCCVVLEVDHCCIHLHRDEIEGHVVESHEITISGICKDCR
ncbi:MAG: transcriptional repressor [Lentisphaeraceae bacterium]|nr:transcriptional repressor [Lentisphaeraceae bacterium]